MMEERDDEFLTIHEIVKRARTNLNQNYWDYLAGGTESETTLRRNRMGLDSIAFRPRVLRDVSTIDTSGRLLGHRLRIPVLLAPIGSLESFHPGGGASASLAAARFGTINIQSSVSSPNLEETAAAADNPKIFQLYVRGDDSWIDDHVRRAVDAGYVAFCLTVDTAIYSRRERDIAKRFVKPWRQRARGLEFQAGLNWGHVERFKAKWNIPLILKGIATAEDATLAVERGVDVVYVSNHGGRQLDHGRGAIEVLPEVVEAVGGKAEVVIDGSFTRGTDVVKALALGADAVAVGRLLGAGLAAKGVDGVVRVLELLEDEITSALGLLGVKNFGELDRSYLRAAQPVNPPHVTSAFPLLNLADEGY